ncbi:MAG: flagellar biosynthetic protein FliR [Fimbriimonadaceae bacterium]|nr:flagellar biosynthetic protein FliR [Fimbriimonadaceae bacterium]QYK57131.1 MAG: flagellar biosynthetic protein FliR [Fimbriimonadaceae bacterium]
MAVDVSLILSGLLIFCRIGALLMAITSLGNMIPVSIRIGVAACLSICLTPILRELVVPMDSWEALALQALGEIARGLCFGGAASLLILSAGWAGQLIDTQIGISSAQVLNPSLGEAITPFGTLYRSVGVFVLFLSNGHSLLLKGIIRSFEIDPLKLTEVSRIGSLLEQCLGIALTLAMPVVMVTVIVDVTSAVINKAVPQVQPFFLSLPLKLVTGIGVASGSCMLLAPVMDKAGIVLLGG